MLCTCESKNSSNLKLAGFLFDDHVFVVVPVVGYIVDDHVFVVVPVVWIQV